MYDDYRRGATEEEIEHMRQLLREALELGAFGMSAGLEYVPGRWATTDEMKELVGELAKFDGVYMLHERSSGTTPTKRQPRNRTSIPKASITCW
jgi:N-acyl-D-amino-acid deacylase